RTLRAVGLGELLAQLEALRVTLAGEGLFAPERKQPLPFLPRRIGLICGRNSAAQHDVQANVWDRWPGIPFDVREVAVQGAQAVPEVVAALNELASRPEVDVIVITRGGGSVEDLLPFSNETLVRAVAACRTPVVSAIGHEQDAPLLDFVADLRASTPTDAAKRIVPSWREQSQLIQTLAERGRRSLQQRADLLDRQLSDTHRGFVEPSRLAWNLPT
ncbi:MAG: exodeoxyribonuclease VII large subunit, partial [Actinomycetales bacterium]